MNIQSASLSNATLRPNTGQQELQQNALTGNSDSQSVNRNQSTAHDLGKLSKAMDALNHKLAPSNVQVQFDTTAPAHEIWLNVVNQTTGEVIQKIPPDGIRKLLEGGAASTGLVVDKPL